MSNLLPPVEATEALADEILKRARIAKMSHRTLSAKSGIPYATLRAQLIYQPTRLTAENVFAIATALEVTVSDLVA